MHIPAVPCRPRVPYLVTAPEKILSIILEEMAAREGGCEGHGSGTHLGLDVQHSTLWSRPGGRACPVQGRAANTEETKSHVLAAPSALSLGDPD
jgi:hypothetical protein